MEISFNHKMNRYLSYNKLQHAIMVQVRQRLQRKPRRVT